MNRILGAFMGVAAFGYAALAPSLATAEVTLEILHAWGSHGPRFYQPIADEFMKAHPDIKIVFRAPAANYDEGHLTVLRESLTDSAPDIWFSSHQLLGGLVHTLQPRGQIVDLTPFLEAEGQEWVSKNYDPHVLDLDKVNGQQWAMPFCASTPIVYYNLDLVSKAGGDPANLPFDWDGVISLAKKIHGLGADTDGLTISLSPDGDWLWQAIVFGYGGTIMNPAKTEVTLGGEAGLQSVRLIRRLVAETGMPLLNEEQGIQQYVAGKMGMFFGSTAEVRTMDDAVSGKFEVRTAKFPLGDPKTGGLPTGGNGAVILSNDPEKQKAAWEFIKFATGPLGQKMVVLGSGYMPTNLNTAGPDYLGNFYKEHPNWTTSMKQWPIAKPWFGYPGSKGVKIWREQSAIISSLAVGDITPDAGLKEIVEVTQRLVKE